MHALLQPPNLFHAIAGDIPDSLNPLTCHVPHPWVPRGSPCAKDYCGSQREDACGHAKVSSQQSTCQRLLKVGNP